MSQIIKLLENKNFWLNKYLSCNEAFLQALKHAPDIALEELELFYGNRESLLKIMADIDKKIQLCVDDPEARHKEISGEDKTRINFFLREKDSMLTRIVELDAEIIGLLEILKAQSGEKLNSLSKAKKALAKYKSNNKYSEKIDGKA